tara:strand:+ start:331 stop:678 length:348 start_codon:yes stop_codon:yes gene_type:complete
MEVVMKKQNEVIAKIEWYADRFGGEVTIQRYEYIREAIVEVRFGDCNMTVNIGSRGAIKYCSWFLKDEQGRWTVSYDDQNLAGIQKARSMQMFLDLVRMIDVKVSEADHSEREAA